MSGSNLKDLCKQMKDMGYTHASLTSINDLVELQHEGAKKLNTGPKPLGIYFSPIVEQYIEDEDPYGPEGYVPQWYEWIINEKFEVDKYLRKDLLFIKADPEMTSLSKIIDQSNMRVNGGKYNVNHDGMKWIDWGKVQSDGFYGVHIKNQHEDWVSRAGWDMETIVVWDIRCNLISWENSRLFVNSGNPFQYNIPISVRPAYMDADISRVDSLLRTLEQLHDKISLTCLT